MLAFIYIPVIQKELDLFRTTVWNHGRGRKQPNKQLPTGIPEVIFENPEDYQGENYGVELNENELLDVAEATNVLDKTKGFLSDETLEEFNEVIDIEQVQSKDAAEAFIYLKSQF